MQLAEAVGISKGSFYKFFESKELLFFAALEDIHTEGYAVAQQALRDNAALPQEVKSAHYHDDEVHIRALLEGSGLQPKGGMALAAATVRGLILTVSHQEQIGELYPKVLETLVRGEKLCEAFGGTCKATKS